MWLITCYLLATAGYTNPYTIECDSVGLQPRTYVCQRQINRNSKLTPLKKPKYENVAILPVNACIVERK